MPRKDDLKGFEHLQRPPGTWTSVGAGWPLLASLTRTAASQTDPVRLGNVFVPRTFELTITVDDKHEDWVLSLMYAVREEEKDVWLVSALSHPRDLDDALTRITKLQPLEWWKRHAVVSLVASATANTINEIEGEERSREGDAVIARAIMKAGSMPLARRRNRITDKHLREVAEVYREAWGAGGMPTTAVSEHFHTTHSTAARWVGLARKAGHLGAADGSRGGEVK